MTSRISCVGRFKNKFTFVALESTNLNPMETTKSATDILKTAILLERRGKAFYTLVARQTESKSARKIFEMMAEEEDAHVEFLSRQFSNYEKNHAF